MAPPLEFLILLTDSLSSLDLYCSLEVDSFGYFVNKAKTRVYRDSTEPNWNEVRTDKWIGTMV